MTQIRYVAYAPNGARQGTISFASDSTFSSTMNEVPACTINYKPNAPGFDLLNQPVEVAVEASADGTTWAEIPNGRYIRRDRSFEQIGAMNVRQFVLPGYGWLLNKTIQWETENLNEDGKRPFLSATVGKIMKTLIDEAQARGWNPGMTYNFTATNATSGGAWDKVITIYYEPGISLYTILDNLSQQGMCDWRFQGRELQIYKADTVMGVTRPNVRLQAGVDVKALPVKASISEMISDALVIGDGGITLELTNPAIAMPWGRWEGSISNSGVNDPGTMTLLGQALMDDGSAEKIQYTAEMKMDTSTYHPLVNFKPGEYIEGPAESSTYELYRIRQINGKVDAKGKVALDLVLNDRFTEREIRNAKKTNGITGGSTAGGTGGRPTPPTADTVLPKAPTGLIFATGAYLDATGIPRATMTINWTPVTEGVNNVVMTIDRYEVQYRDTSAIWQVFGTSATAQLMVSDLPVDTTYNFRVIAIAEPNGRRSAPSAVSSYTTALDTTPPPVPSAPSLTSNLGTITVTWDGLAAAGGSGVPKDFARLEVAMGATATPTAVVGIMSGKDFVVITGQPYNTPRYFRFRSIDTSGNTSAWSAATNISTKALVDTDLIDTTIQTQITAINTKADAALTSANGKNKSYYQTTAPTGGTYVVGDTWFDTANNNRISRWTGSTWSLAVLGTAALILGSGVNLIPNGAGERGDLVGWPSTLTWDTTDMPAGLAGSFRSTPGQGTAAASGEFFDVQPSTQYLTEIWVKADKPNSVLFVEMRNQDGVQGATHVTAPGSPSTGSASYILGSIVVPTVWTKYTVVTTPIASTTRLRIGGLYFNHTNGTERTAQVWIAGVRMRPRINNSLIVDGTITANEIAVGTITVESGIIASLDAGKIVVGTLSADRIGSKTITSDKILIGSGESLLGNPNFSASGLGWSQPAGVSFGEPGGGINGTRDVIITGSSTQNGTYFGLNDLSVRTRVVPGSVYRLSAWVTSNALMAIGSVAIFIRWYDENNTLIGSISGLPNSTAMAPDLWHQVTNLVTAPVGASRGVMGLFKQAAHTTTVRWSSPAMQPAVNGELIVDGSIIASMITAGAITAGKIATNAIIADNITAGAVTATKVASNAITTDKLDANAITAKHTITGATIQTSATANRGVKIDSGGIQAFDNLGNQTLAVDVATGNVTIVGEMRTGFGLPYARMTANARLNRPGVKFVTENSDELDPILFATGLVDGGGYSANTLVMSSGEGTINSSGRSEIKLARGGTWQIYQAFGAYSNLGITFYDGRLKMEGALPPASSRSTFSHRNTGVVNAATWYDWGTTPALPFGFYRAMAAAVTATPESIPVTPTANRTSSGVRVWLNHGAIGGTRNISIDILRYWTELDF